MVKTISQTKLNLGSKTSVSRSKTTTKTQRVCILKIQRFSRLKSAKKIMPKLRWLYAVLFGQPPPKL